MRFDKSLQNFEKPLVDISPHITSKVKQYYLSYRPRTECSISQFFKTNCTHSIFRTINCRLFNSETVKKICKITYTASQFSLLTSAKFAVNRLIELCFNINNLFIYFLFKGFITMCNLEKRLIRAAKR